LIAGYFKDARSALFVTHAHIDHIGRIPKLVREGFRGRIISTAATRDIAEVLLQDALSIGVRNNNELYSEKDIVQSFAQWEVAPYHHAISLGDAKVQMSNSGHILGSSIVVIEAEGKRIVFTGDLGNTPSILLHAPEQIQRADYLIIESAYGNREHEGEEERVLRLERAVEDITARGGTLMIPAFATERTQDVLFLLNQMLHLKRIPQIPFFVDSPLATRVTKIFEHYIGEYREDIRELLREHPNLFQFKLLTFTESVEESKGINSVPAPKVIIAGSGMMNGGRILHHLKRYLPDSKSILLIVGYQGAGSLGRRLIDGDRLVKIFGEEIPVEAEIRKINGFSAHADNPQLFSFVATMKDSLKRVFIVQGEEPQALHLQQEIQDRLGVSATAPLLGDEVEL
jgi:metallo-beta-lactamase family protein